ncbi:MULTISPECIES: flagellar protein FlgN [unclassified Pseudomonas]|uniref:flagellar protein FlgN n=1 Tax=unclassified Pseudomonas TaxID=196821 RepID=UPI002E807641|nr:MULTISPECIES: flagellar protein FlgN [unclassified Pseudomonas]
MSDKREQLLSVLERDIQKDCADYLRLRGLMQELYEFLLSRDMPCIDVINQQVTELVGDARMRAERRSKGLAAFRLQGDAPGLYCLFELYPGVRRTQLQQCWNQLGQLASQCQRLNERNGQLLAMHNDILTQLLSQQSDSGLYGQHPY